MKKSRLIFLVLFLIGVQATAMAQVDTTTARIDTVVIDTSVIRGVTLPPPEPDTADAGEQKPLFKVVPWEFHPPIGAELIETDSTLRWQIWPDWTYKLNRDPGVISYRMGTGLRSNAVQRYAHEPRHQQLYWEGISLNDPVSGMLNWSLIPQHKIGEFYGRDLGTEYRSTFYLRQYYLNKPLSRLIYSESKFTHRNLEFEVSHNLSQRTNVEVSYWDRRTGGGYPNTNITGRQIFGKVSHHLDHQRFLKLNYMTNKYDIGRPFGYQIPNLQNYNFDRFSATANETSALSTEITSLLALNYYQRSPDTTEAVDNFHSGIFYRGNERKLDYSADSTRYKVRSIGINARKWYNIGGLLLEGGANYEYFFNQTNRDESLPASNWSLLETEGKVSLDFTPIIDLKGRAGFQYRTDGYQSYNITASSDIELGGFTLTPGASMGTVMPTQQQLHWEGEFTGNPDLQNEKINEVRGTLSYNFTPDTRLGIRGQHKDIRDGIMVSRPDSTFRNVISYASQSATAFLEWDLTHFEFDASATAQRFTDSYLEPTGTVPMVNAKRVWMKGSVYWKGYLFDRATYIKAGLSGMMSPFRYQADHYIPSLDYWQPVSEDQLLPVYNRLDIDISARVRSIMFVLRWENVLDDVNQLGYFEAAGYPMSGRRFIFGVRALFRN